MKLLIKMVILKQKKIDSLPSWRAPNDQTKSENPSKKNNGFVSDI